MHQAQLRVLRPLEEVEVAHKVEWVVDFPCSKEGTVGGRAQSGMGCGISLRQRSNSWGSCAKWNGLWIFPAKKEQLGVMSKVEWVVDFPCSKEVTVGGHVQSGRVVDFPCSKEVTVGGHVQIGMGYGFCMQNMCNIFTVLSGNL